MGQQMQLSIQPLQMSVQELDAYLRELSLENPLLEELPPQQVYRPLAISRGHVPADEDGEEPIPDEKRGTLREFIREQVLSLRVPELMRRELLYLTNEMDDDPDDSIPRITWGKFEAREGRLLLPCSVQLNHRLLDGWHLGQLLTDLQRELDAF